MSGIYLPFVQVCDAILIDINFLNNYAIITGNCRKKQLKGMAAGIAFHFG